MINQDAFAKLLKKSQALINYVDTFILKNESNKIGDVNRVGQYNMKRMDMYEHLCYAARILQTLLSVLPKKNSQCIRSQNREH